MLPATGMLLHWVSEYGYPFLGVLLLISAAGVPIPIELLLVALGALSASQSGPSFAMLVAVGIGATVAGDALDYVAGRVLGRPVIERWLRGKLPKPRYARHDAELLAGGSAPWQVWAHRLLAWSGSGPMILLTRCVLTPLEMPVSLVAGASRRSFRSFLVWDVLGEALYVLGYLALGRAGGTLATSGPLLLAFGLLAATLSAVPLLFARWLTSRGFEPRARHPLQRKHQAAFASKHA